MALIHIKKRALPIELDFERAKKLKQRKYGYDGIPKADNSDQVDLGEWAGQFGEIISIDTSIENRTDKTEKTYSKEECKVFEKELKPYLDEKGGLTLKGELEFLRDSEIITLKLKDGLKGVVITDFDIAVIKDNSNAYRPLVDKIEAWRNYRGRYHYAKRMEDKEMEKLAEGMRVEISNPQS